MIERKEPVPPDALARHVVLRHVLVERAIRVGQIVAMVIGKAGVTKRHDATHRIVAASRFRDPEMSGFAEAGLEEGVPRRPLNRF